MHTLDDSPSRSTRRNVFVQSLFLGRAEFGAMVSVELKIYIPCSDNGIHLVNLSDGVYISEMKLDGTPRSAVVMDPWTGSLWGALDNCTIAVIRADMRKPLQLRISFVFILHLQHTCRLEAPGLVSGALVFHKDMHLVAYSTLQGTVVILAKDSNKEAYSSTVFEAPDPIFGSPQWSHNKLIFCTVAGDVHALDSTGTLGIERLFQIVFLGRLLWKTSLKDQVFAPVAPSCESQSAWIFVATQSGRLLLMDRVGQIQSTIELNCGPISRQPFILATEEHSVMHMVLTTNKGTLCIFKIDTGKAHIDVSVLGVYRMPDEVFSPLLIWQQFVLFGCRDNHVYCLEMCLGNI